MLDRTTMFAAVTALLAWGCAPPPVEPAVQVVVPPAPAHASAPAPTEPPAPPAHAPLPSHYAALFEKGRRFRYRVTHELSYLDDNGVPAKDESAFELACEIVEVTRAAEEVRSRMECDKPLGLSYVQTIGAHYVATPAGLWVVDPASPERADALAPRQMLIAARPQPGRTEHEEEDGSESYEVKADGGGWCATHGTLYGDEASREACFDAGGISRTWWLFGGGRVEEYKASRLPE